MGGIERLPASALCSRCDAGALPFESTSQLDVLTEPLGQARAVEAAQFAIALRREGYNLFVIGPSGYGKHEFVRNVLDDAAASREAPPDYLYVHDFEHPERPRVLSVPTGRGARLGRDLDKLVEDLRAAIPAAFESDDYRARLAEIEQEFRARPEAAFHEVEEEAKEAGIAMVRLPSGVGFAPLKDGEVLSPDQFSELPQDEQTRLEGVVEGLQKKLGERLRLLPSWGKEARDKARALAREVTSIAVEQLMEDLRIDWADLPAVIAHLDAVRADVLENVDEFRKEEEGSPLGLDGKRRFSRYRVNVLVDNAASDGAPVIYEDRPSLDRLLGRVEHRAELGALVTDFMLIKAGSLHRANGGYLVVDARELLTQPQAWQSLKRALYAREIRIESLTQLMGLSSTATLSPEPIPLEAKVVVVGDRYLYHMLSEVDPDVGELFKVVADFEEQIERNAENDLAYSRLIATLERRDGLRPFQRSAVARVLEQSARSTGDSRKLSTRVRDLAELLQEADYFAAERGGDQVQGEDVDGAVRARDRRRARLRELMQEQILKGTLLIATSGEDVGQINGLSVLEFGGFRFGIPTRITATARVGDGKVVDIEREVELGGALHSKGVLILTSYFGARYTRHIPLSLSASLVFEQSYYAVEGDSASLAELIALISALSGVPVRQHIAITGSVNQHGDTQAIGGVNEKIEGFFDVCSARGLTGEHGVVIPASNVPHLMLRDDVVEACRKGEFSVYAVHNVDEAVEVLTGRPAGDADENGDFPEDSVNALVLEQLVEFAVIAEGFSKFLKMTAGGTPPEGAEG